MPQLEFTPSQQDAIESTGESMAVIAGAGSGKTLVLIERLRRIIDEPAGGLDRLLAITFTEKAAAELKAKIRTHLKADLLANLSSAWIGTFHSFCSRILRLNAPSAGLDPSFKILDENGARLLARRSVEESFLNLLDNGDKSAAHLVEELEYRNAMGMLEDLMSFRWHAAKFFETTKPADERDKNLIRAAADCFGAARAEFEAHLARINALDFQDIEIRALDLLSNSPDILSQYRKRFRHILVDEYQDTNDIQTELVRLLFHPGSNKLFVVGDPRQSIYRFRGANVSCFFDIIEHIKNSKGRLVHLSENFRSLPGIIRFVNSTASSLEESLFDKTGEAKLIPHRDETFDSQVTALFCHSDEDSKVGELREIEADAIAGEIRKIVDAKDADYGDIVCLFQAITAISSYESAFRRHKIPYRVYGGRQLLGRPEITDLVAALNFAANPANDTALITLARSPLIGLSDDECVLLAGKDGNEFRNSVRKHPKAKILSLLENAGIHRRPSEILRLVLDETGYEIFSAEIDPSGGRLSNIDRLITLAESLERESPVSLASFVDFIAALRKESARLGDPPAAEETGKLVRCMTVHAAKGLEFPIVFLPDLVRKPVNQGGAWIFVRSAGLGFKWRDQNAPFGPMIPSESYTAILNQDKSEEETESLRLLYVAMTRAKDRLIFPVHEKEMSAWRWHKWIKPLIGNEGVELVNVRQIDEEKEPCEPSSDTPGLTRLARLARLTRSTNTFTVSELESFDRCPQEYYLKYVAGLPAEMILAKKQSGIPANIRGSIIHGVIEKIMPGENDNIVDLIRDECLSHQIFPDSAAINKLSKPLDAFRKNSLFAELSRGTRELEFHLKLGKNIIKGKIDWLRNMDDGFEIIDFKTDRISKDEVAKRAKDYHLQMTAYALAANAGKNAPVRRTVLYFLDPEVAHGEIVNEKRLENGLGLIESIVARIDSGDYNLGDFVPPCAETDSRCPYHLNGLCWLDWGKKK